MLTQKSKQKIAFFHFAFLYSGGGEKLALQEMSLLRSEGYTVDAFTSLIDKESCFPDITKNLTIQEIIPGFTRIFKDKPEIGIIITCILFPLVAFRFRKYDFVFAANQPGPIFGLILKVLFNIPYIIYLAQPTRLIYPRQIDKKHGLKIRNAMRMLPHFINVFRPFIFWIDLKSIACSSQFLCNGEYMVDTLSKIYGLVPTNCPAGAKTQHHDVSMHKRNTQSKLFTLNNSTIRTPYILVSNRHVPQKQLENAIYIAESLDYEISIVFTGEETLYTDQLKKIAINSGIVERVNFVGYINEEELSQLYKNAAIYLYTAPEEDFGMGIVEAMSFGIPTIAWDKAGPSKIITNQHDGFLANLNDFRYTRNIIIDLLKDEKLYLKISKNAHYTATNSYSLEKHGRTCCESIESISKLSQTNNSFQLQTITTNIKQ